MYSTVTKKKDKKYLNNILHVYIFKLIQLSLTIPISKDLKLKANKPKNNNINSVIFNEEQICTYGILVHLYCIMENVFKIIFKTNKVSE